MPIRQSAGSVREKFGEDMAKIAARFSAAELRAIAEWIAATTDALVANTHRITSHDQAQADRKADRG